MFRSANYLGSSGSEIWTKKRQVTITNPVGNVLERGYTLRVPIPQSVKDLCRTDLNDLRLVYVTESLVQELRTYWKADESVLYFAIPELIASGVTNNNFYLVYSNPNAGPRPNDPEKVFLFFDDFSGDLSKWVAMVPDGLNGVSIGTVDGVSALIIQQTVCVGLGFRNKTPFDPRNTAIEYRGKECSDADNSIQIFSYQDGNNMYYSYFSPSTSRSWDFALGGTVNGVDLGQVLGLDNQFSQNVWYKIRFANIASATKLRMENIDNPAQYLESVNSAFDDLTSTYLAFGRWNTPNSLYQYVDWIRVRRFVSTDSSITVNLGSEIPF